MDTTKGPQALAREFYRPLATEETRRAVGRWLDAKRRLKEVNAAFDVAFDSLASKSASINTLSAFAAALANEAMDAERALLRLIVAWDDQAIDRRINDAERNYWPPRGVVVDGVLYAVIPVDPDECEGLERGERPGNVVGDTTWVLRVHAVPLASVVNLDSDDAVADLIPRPVTGTAGKAPGVDSGASEPAPAAVDASIDDNGTARAPAARPIARHPWAGPLLRGHLTFTPPWAAENPLTMELVIVAGGTGAECEDHGGGFDKHPNACPTQTRDVPELQQAGWSERESVGLTASVRFID